VILLYNLCCLFIFGPTNTTAKKTAKMRFVILVPVFIVIGLGLYSLIGWFVGYYDSNFLEMKYVPIAPLTALFFFLISSIILANTFFSGKPTIKKASFLAIIALMGIAILIVFKYAFDFDLDPESSLSKSNASVKGHQIGRMSPITGILFLMVLINLLLSIKTKYSEIQNTLFGWMYIVSGTGGGIIILGYLYKAPLLYGSSVIPVALVTAICFVLISVYFMFVQPSDCFPKKFFFGRDVKSILARNFFPLFVISLFVFGYVANFNILNNTNPVLSISMFTIIVSIVIGYIIIRIANKIGSKIEKLNNENNQLIIELDEKNEKLKEQYEEIESQNEELRQSNTELKKAKEKAEESDRMKTIFLANVSHELRTPLNGIIGFSGLLQKRDLEEEKIKQYSSIIDQSGKQLLTIINDLLDISSMDKDNIEIIRTKVDINGMMDELKTLYSQTRLQFKKEPIELATRYGADDFSFFSDEKRLKQIFINLLNNAYKFSKSGKIVFGYFFDNNSVVFFVEDKGIGIDPKNQEMIFDRFKQVESNFSRKYSGMGLGLSIVKNLVELMKGRIWLKSELGKGSTFYFSFSLENNDHNLIIRNASEIKNLNVLIVEDEDVNAEYLSEVLKGKVKKTMIACGGFQAIEMLKGGTEVDLVLLDIHMPGLDGVETFKMIRKSGNSVPVIAQTAFANTEDRERFIDIGFDGYLSKPMTEAQLVDEISKVVSLKVKSIES